jgi:hypothetical protein
MRVCRGLCGAHGAARYTPSPVVYWPAGCSYESQRLVPGSARGGKDAVRTYRLAGMLALTVGTRSFKRPRAFDLVGYWQESAARFEAELRHLQARVRVSRRAMGWLHHARTKCAPCPARSTRPAVAGQLGRGATLTASMHLNREVQ